VYSLTRNRNLIARVFPISEFDLAMALAIENEDDHIQREYVANRRPRQILGEAFSFDWDMTENVSARLEKAWQAARDDHGFWDRILDDALSTVDADKRQASISRFIEMDGIRWRRNGLPIHLLEEALAILDESAIDIGVSPASIAQASTTFRTPK
jgi:hypothetical protein